MENGNGSHGSRRNGNAATSDGATQSVQPEVLPPYEPAPRVPGTVGCVVVRKEVVFALGGVVIGAWGMYMLMRALQKK